ncbi:MAG: MFS transporter [Lachnospiraceae bacterium]|nr:MFS transporter [Lachnospiraceae bacterium]
MYTTLLIIIYLAFISLGLPDSLLGAAWPSMQPELMVPVSYAGGISIIISGCTIVSSLVSNYVIHKLGTGKVTAISVTMTAIALMGFAMSGSYWQLCLWGIPYGLGAGSVDAALNNYVALHYEAKHMSWLHCFWGVGTTIGPAILGRVLTSGLRWNLGYWIISGLQIALAVALFATLPIWNKQANASEEKVEEKQKPLSLWQVIKLPAAKGVMTGFFCYCAVESTAGLWAASYMVLNRGMSAEVAARWGALFYMGITIGRFLSGFLTMKMNDKNMIRLGQGLIAGGIVFLLLPLGDMSAFSGLILIGLGCAPIYPCLIHATPDTFGAGVSQSVIGVQMASAYVGATFMPSLFGIIADWIGIVYYPIYMFMFLVFMIVMLEQVNRLNKSKISYVAKG